MNKSKLLQLLVKDIAKATARVTTAKEAEEQNHKSYLYLEHNSAYGGYRLITLDTTNGSHGSLPGMSSTEGRKGAKEMETYLRGILIGLNLKKDNL